MLNVYDDDDEEKCAYGWFKKSDTRFYGRLKFLNKFFAIQL